MIVERNTVTSEESASDDTKDVESQISRQSSHDVEFPSSKATAKALVKGCADAIDSDEAILEIGRRQGEEADEVCNIVQLAPLLAYWDVRGCIRCLSDDRVVWLRDDCAQGCQKIGRAMMAGVGAVEYC